MCLCMLQKHNHGRINALNVTLTNTDLTWWRFRLYYREHLKYQKEKRKKCHNKAKETGSNKNSVVTVPFHEESEGDKSVSLL